MSADFSPLPPDPVTPEDHTQGPDDAALTLVLYGDFQCPYTRQALPALNAARDALGERLRFAFRHFPLVDIHPHALAASEISEVAADIGLFWEMFEVLFSRQHHLENDDLIRYAEEFGVDDSVSVAALSQFPHRPRIQRDIDSGSRAGLTGTPAFYLNGHHLVVDGTSDGLLSTLRDHLKA